MRTLYIISLFVWLIGFIGCYEDKGNYDYADVFEIRIDSIKDSYKLYALADTLRIAPEIEPADADYDFHWCVYQTNVQGYAPTLDTLATTRELVWPVTLAPGTYCMVFMATEKNTGITRIKESPLTVTTALSEGWYVLRTKDGYTDLDLFSTSKGKMENVIASSNGGRNLKGEARAIEYDTRYKSWDETSGRYINTNTLLVLSGADIVAMKTSDGSVIRDAGDIFYERPDDIDPQNWVVISNDHYLINNGKAHTIYGMGVNSGRFGVAASGDYRLSSFRTYGFRNLLCFDEKSCSFVAVSALNGASVIPFSDEGEIDSLTYPPVNDLDAGLLYMGPGPDYTGWALLKKKSEPVWLMYNVDLNKAYSPYKNPVNTCDTLDSALKLLQADVRASSQDNNIIYFASGNTIWSCNADAGYAEKEQLTVPDGEITYMRYMKCFVYGNPALTFSKLAVATFDGKDYKVYLYSIQAGNLQPQPEVLAGEGKVGALIYIDGSRKTTLY